MKWFAQAPANIALIKYMGKADTQSNTPTNGSLSYTLNDLLSFVELENHGGDEDFWEALAMPASHLFSISEKAQTKFIAHLQFIKRELDFEGGFIIRSCNNFPADCGLASSASSFAALTKCAVRAICELQQRDELDATQMALLSRIGSGSSCRSFFSPWALWETDGNVQGLDFPFNDLIHDVVVISREAKAVPSSEAHQRVQTSPKFAGRAERAQQRLADLQQALSNSDWQAAATIAWDEFIDMHELFTTAEPSFKYHTDAGEKVLADIDRYWQKNNDGPIVTMDAGPNIHLLFRRDQHDIAQEMKQTFLNHHDVI
jgi:diphosphomevalonate decarboxylase